VAGDFRVQPGEITSISCSGQNSGRIELAIEGGIGPFQYEWSHDPNLNSPLATQLVAGSYSVKVKDQLGCEQLIESIEVTEPAPLALSSLSPVGVSCYGKPDGEVTLNISGGVTPYTFDYEGTKTFSGSISLQDLPQGQYAWEVKDSNGCAIPVTFEITSPAALEVDVRLEKPACPGGSNGELFAMPKGGAAPFIYLWKDTRLSGNLVTGLSAGTYDLEVSDASGCVSVGRGTVEEAAPVVRMPTGFDPRQAPGIYQGVSNCETAFQLWIYNRWGQLIYSGSTGWDGTVSGDQAPTGTYSYAVEYLYQLEGKSEKTSLRGTFTLIR
jgi:gliding motility-associated-like protein